MRRLKRTSMNIFSGSVRFTRAHRSAKRFVLFLAILAFSAGCSHKNEQPAPSPQQTNSSISNTNAAATAEPDLAELNRAMRRWLIANRRPPKNFGEFAATAGVPIPPPPAGKKYIIAPNMHVELVDAK